MLYNTIKTKNWGGRIEATETSGRLHLLWLQNKQIHSPRTTDRLHTRQDRWIQKELARTHTKNATKLNPLEIIPLQPTRKKNNWETEEAMERAAVTLKTERVKWPNPGCLWWWWWISNLIVSLSSFIRTIILWRTDCNKKLNFALLYYVFCRAVFLNRRAAARYRSLASIIPGREGFSSNLSF